MALNERDFFVEKQETKPASCTCPLCKRRNEYQVHWVRRLKKGRLPPGADERDRAMFAKLRSYMIRTDDVITCSTCRKRFEVPTHQSLFFLQDGPEPSASKNIDYDDDNFGNR